MTLSIYDVSIPLFLRGFDNLSAILKKGEAFAIEKGVSFDGLVDARLFDDMLPLAGQIQRASDTAKACVARLAGVEAPRFPDEEKTFADLGRRIDGTVAYLKSIPPAQMEGAEDRPLTLRLSGSDRNTIGRDYLFRHALPNFYFHIATAYDILRHRGVPLGKRDYLGVY